MTPEDRSALAHDASAAEVAFRQHYAEIERYLRRRLGDDAGEDATSEVFARALKAQRRGQEVSVGWLFGVAVNVIRERRRSERRRMRAIERLAARGVREQEASGEPPSQLDPELIAALRRLAPGDREALLLVAWGELTYEQTAEALGLPIGTVRSRIHRARGQLRAVYDREPLHSGGAQTGAFDV